MTDEMLITLTTWATGLLPYAYAFVGLIVLDFVGAVALALKNKTFQLERLGDFAINAGLYLLGWLMAETLAFLPTFFGIDVAGLGEIVANGFGLLTYGAIVLKYVGSILGHITAIKEINAVKKLGVEPTGQG